MGTRSMAGRRALATGALWTTVVALLVLAGSGQPQHSDAAPPPAGRSAHGAAGSGLNGTGGEIAPSPTSASWPGTGPGGNGGPFAFIGAHYGPAWGIPSTSNNALGVGYCIMEDVAGEGVATAQPDPSAWNAGEQARAAALMATFGGDRVVPYGIDSSGPYDLASGEWQQPSLLGGGEYTRRRHVAVNFGVKMFVEDVSPSGSVAGRKLARDVAVVNGTGGDFPALRNGYLMAQRLANVADRQHAVGGVDLTMTWSTPDGAAPTTAGTYPLEVRATDSTGKPVGFIPVAQLSTLGIDDNRSVGTTVAVDNSGDSPDDRARWSAADAARWPTWDMAATMATDRRFLLEANRLAADVTNANGVARFDVTIVGPSWELAFHAQAPTDDVALYSGTGVQGQITWEGRPQSASVHQAVTPPPPPEPPVGSFLIRKVLDRSDIQADRDMSGFTFDVSDGVGSERTSVVTGADGRTPPIDAVAGEYQITESARPDWASGLIDGGPVTFTFDPVANPGPVEVTYENRVPDATLDTSARDALDGDRSAMLGPASGAVVVDTITYRGLVPDTQYQANGELLVVPGDGPPQPTGIAASTTFTPEHPDGAVDVTFEIPPDSVVAGNTAVVYQRVAVASTGRVVATHEDPGADAQTIRFPTLVTHLEPDWPTGDGDGDGEPDWPSGDREHLTDADEADVLTERHQVMIGEPLADVVTYRALDPRHTYRAELTLQRRTAAGECAPTDIAASIDFTPDATNGSVRVPGISAPSTGIFVAFERLLAVEPDGTTRLVVVHEDCDEPRQTVHVVAPVAPPATSPVPTTAPNTTVPPMPTTAPPDSTNPPTTSTPPSLPRTGSGTTETAIATAIALVLMGAGLTLVARRSAGAR